MLLQRHRWEGRRTSTDYTGHRVNTAPATETEKQESDWRIGQKGRRTCQHQTGSTCFADRGPRWVDAGACVGAVKAKQQESTGAEGTGTAQRRRAREGEGGGGRGAAAAEGRGRCRGFDRAEKGAACCSLALIHTRTYFGKTHAKFPSQLTQPGTAIRPARKHGMNTYYTRLHRRWKTSSETFHSVFAGTAGVLDIWSVSGQHPRPGQVPRRESAQLDRTILECQSRYDYAVIAGPPASTASPPRRHL